MSGGRSRQESSAIGVEAIDDDEAIVLLHDVARPLVSSATVTSCIEAARTHGAADVAIETADTIVVVTVDGMIDSIPDRRTLRRGQTPQAFRAAIIKEFSGQDFLPAIDDLVKEAGKARKPRPPRQP